MNLYDVSNSLFSYRRIGFVNTCLVNTFRSTPNLLGEVLSDIESDFQTIHSQLDQFVSGNQPLVDDLSFAEGSSHRATSGDLVTFITVRGNKIVYELRDRRTQNYIVFTYQKKSRVCYIDHIFGLVPDLNLLLKASSRKYPRLLKNMKQVMP